jgi:hypothetical protein
MPEFIVENIICEFLRYEVLGKHPFKDVFFPGQDYAYDVDYKKNCRIMIPLNNTDEPTTYVPQCWDTEFYNDSRMIWEHRKHQAPLKCTTEGWWTVPVAPPSEAVTVTTPTSRKIIVAQETTEKTRSRRTGSKPIRSKQSNKRMFHDVDDCQFAFLSPKKPKHKACDVATHTSIGIDDPFNIFDSILDDSTSETIVPPLCPTIFLYHLIMSNKQAMKDRPYSDCLATTLHSCFLFCNSSVTAKRPW